MNVFFTKKIFIPIALFALVLLLFVVLGTGDVFAQGSYKLLAPLPGGEEELDRGSSLLSTYIGIIFTLALSAAAILALLMIVVGGVRYVASAVSPNEKNEAKQMIWNAIGGLLVVLLAYVILNTINPDLVGGDFNPSPLTFTGGSGTGGSTGGGGTPGTGGGTTFGLLDFETHPVFAANPHDTDREQSVRGFLNRESGGQIEINRQYMCPDGMSYEDFGKTTGTGCTSVGGFLPETIDGTLFVQESCNCGLVITGGSESGHASGPNSHESGKKVDLRPSPELDAWIEDNTTIQGNTRTGQFPNPSGGTVQVVVRDERNIPGVDPHWDIQFTP